MSVALFPVDKIIVGSTAKKKICVLSHKGSVKDLSHKKNMYEALLSLSTKNDT